MQHSETLNVEGRKIVYWVVDLVPPWKRTDLQTVVFHHGLAVHPEQWFDWFPNLINDYRIVYFDMFGTGRSSLDGSEEDWSMQARIRDLFALADHLQLQRFHFVGESYGGTLGLAAGLQAPDRFGSLCIVNASYHGTRLTNTQEFEATVALKGVKAWSDEVLQGRFFRDSLSDEMWEWYSAQQANHSMTSIISILRELRAADMSDQLERLTLPVLYLHSDSSPFISVSVAQDMHSKTRGSELQIFAHSKHGLPFTHGKPCSAALFEFLQRLNGRAQPGINP